MIDIGPVTVSISYIASMSGVRGDGSELKVFDGLTMTTRLGS